MDIQRLRNLTTGILHTDIGYVYQDIGYLTGEQGIMTHMIPNVLRALEPFLRGKITDERLWDQKYDPSHTGDIKISSMDTKEIKEFWERYNNLPSPLEGKKVINVVI